MKRRRCQNSWTQQGWVEDLTLLGLIGLSLFFLPKAATAHPAHAEPVNYPFVVGFERFYSGDDNPEYLAEGGLILLNELNCVACHAAPEALKDRLTGRPATLIEGVGTRLNPLDLELFIRNPRFIKPDTMMPSFFAGPDRDLAEVEALKHFLASLKKEPSDAAMPAGDVAAGQRLYHRIGCVACHAPEVGYTPEDLPEGTTIELTGLPSVPMNLADKYEEHALARFLLDPNAHRPSGRMPNFKLSDAEAADLAAYLKSGPKPEIPEELKAEFDAAADFTLDPAKVSLGKELFASKNCVACHQPAPAQIASAPKPAKPLAELNVSDSAARLGCLSERPLGGGVPSFFLDEVQKKAIEFALRGLSDVAPLDRAGRIDWTMSSLNCYACHERGGKGGPETAREPYFAVNDVGALSTGRWGNLPPPLDKVGRKLTDAWFERILFNRGGDGEVRTYMEARMPVFLESHLQPLLADVKEADVREEPIEIDVSGLPKYQRGHYGRDLLGINGLGCVNCHGLKDRSAIGAPVINLSHTIERLRPEYFKEVLLDPQATQPGTMMPPMFTGRKKANEEVEQIWTYLKELDQRRLPDGLMQTDDFELKPEKDGKPIVFRTFLEGAGTQAVAVGFPEGMHAAFDSRECRWRIAWRGRFLDAMSTWDDRFCAPAVPLGEGITDLSDAFPGASTEAEFLGFRLDAQGIPTFLYEAGGQRIEDRVEPGKNGLTRTIKTGDEVETQTMPLQP
ncbi:MAG: c-type cytochrome [Verrucomicrobiae bacterium]|nr:c-type cytochrome [Verrucomicrobiae bacterium]